MKKVFLLDDDRDLVEIISMIASSEGVSCVTASTFEETLKRKDDVLGCDLALLDIKLGEGEKNGIDTYQWLKEQGYKGRVVFLTAHAGMHPILKVAPHLVNARVLHKPIGYRELKEFFRRETAMAS